MVSPLIDLGWMRVLTEAVRLGSLSAAASSLRLTQPAVSYQVRRMEEQAGFLVLRRHRQGVELTPKGRRLHDIVQRTVADIDALIRTEAAAAGRPTVRLRTDYAFSAYWLMPRMHDFRVQHPEIDIQIVATQRHNADALDEGDVAVVFGGASDDGSGELILAEQVVPVCSPDFLRRHQGLDRLAELAAARLIHLEAIEPAPWFDWRSYFGSAGISRDAIRHHGDMTFNTYSLVVQAAMEHQGVALGWVGLIDSALRSGVLMRIGPQLGASDRGYRLVRPSVSNEQADAFIGWLLKATVA